MGGDRQNLCPALLQKQRVVLVKLNLEIGGKFLIPNMYVYFCITFSFHNLDHSIWYLVIAFLLISVAEGLSLHTVSFYTSAIVCFAIFLLNT